MSNRDTVELMSCSRTMSDAWTELYRNQSVRDLILKLVPGEEPVLRLIGPFVSAQRMFVPFTDSTALCTNDDILDILKEKDSSVSRAKLNALKSQIVGYIRASPRKYFSHDVVKSNGDFTPDACSDNRILELIPSVVFNELQERSRTRPVQRVGRVSSPEEAIQRDVIEASRFRSSNDRSGRLNQFKSLADFIRIMEGRKGWQDCVLVNVIKVDESKIRILPLFRSLLDGIMTECRRLNQRRPGDVKINGFKAHNITITRQGMGPTNSNFRIVLSDGCNYLSVKNMDTVLGEGLIDIPTFVDRLTEKTFNGSYCYRLRTSYKMPEEFYSTIYEEYNRASEKAHVDRVDEDIAEIPSEAFENMQDINNPIASLEI